ncbi:MAG: hypothetical protein ACWGNV_14230, partial [Bacteroidales bacterium]
MNQRRTIFNSLLAAAILFSVQSCTYSTKPDQENESSEQPETNVTEPEATVNKAVCVLHPTEGNDVHGLV